MLSGVIHLLASIINFLAKGLVRRRLKAGLQRVSGTCQQLFFPPLQSDQNFSSRLSTNFLFGFYELFSAFVVVFE